MNAFEFLIVIIVAVAAYWLGANSQTGSISGIGVLTDSATGIDFPDTKSFYVTKPPLSLLAIGTRKKAILNIYSLGMFVSEATKKKLEKSGNACDAIMESTLPKAVQLTFAMGIGPEKIAEAISQLENVDTEVKTKFHDMLIEGMGGGKMQKGESMSFEWKGADTIIATARGSYIGEMRNKALAAGILQLYVGPNSVSPSLLANLGCN